MTSCYITWNKLQVLPNSIIMHCKHARCLISITSFYCSVTILTNVAFVCSWDYALCVTLWEVSSYWRSQMECSCVAWSMIQCPLVGPQLSDLFWDIPNVELQQKTRETTMAIAMIGSITSRSSGKWKARLERAAEIKLIPTNAIIIIIWDTK